VWCILLVDNSISKKYWPLEVCSCCTIAESIPGTMYRLLFLERSRSGLSCMATPCLPCVALSLSAFSAFFCYLLSAFITRSVFRTPDSARSSFSPLSIWPQTQPHSHLCSFLPSLRLLLLEADSSVLPKILDESGLLFPLSFPHFLFM